MFGPVSINVVKSQKGNFSFPTTDTYGSSIRRKSFVDNPKPVSTFLFPQSVRMSLPIVKGPDSLPLFDSGSFPVFF